jgi:hypothetical protein
MKCEERCAVRALYHEPHRPEDQPTVCHVGFSTFDIKYSGLSRVPLEASSSPWRHRGDHAHFDVIIVLFAIVHCFEQFETARGLGDAVVTLAQT